MINIIGQKFAWEHFFVDSAYLKYGKETVSHLLPQNAHDTLKRTFSEIPRDYWDY